MLRQRIYKKFYLNSNDTIKNQKTNSKKITENSNKPKSYDSIENKMAANTIKEKQKEQSIKSYDSIKINNDKNVKYINSVSDDIPDDDYSVEIKNKNVSYSSKMSVDNKSASHDIFIPSQSKSNKSIKSESDIKVRKIVEKISEINSESESDKETIKNDDMSTKIDDMSEEEKNNNQHNNNIFSDNSISSITPETEDCFKSYKSSNISAPVPLLRDRKSKQSVKNINLKSGTDKTNCLCVIPYSGIFNEGPIDNSIGFGNIGDLINPIGWTSSTHGTLHSLAVTLKGHGKLSKSVVFKLLINDKVISNFLLEFPKMSKLPISKTKSIKSLKISPLDNIILVVSSDNIDNPITVNASLSIN
ncbi:hypothetical protein Catovirus_1_350 [Catovirus CTV1]|uniref:Uncharacterized protein n=1 Tax=Catovirus CTV1 TaxID=1977631 RepID=A0A1V0S9A2_9VIRU|nr:hypothetical protein Catovirus_1_350 [Catovirus CTV1]